jgi:hydrogenase maturation protease
MRENMKKITVIGCGQILVGDDGLGVRVVETLQKMDLPGNVEVIDAGVGGLAILSMIENSDKTIIVDAVHTGKEPSGFIYHFTDKELPPPNMFMLSAHDLNLVDTIHIGREMEKLGEQKMPVDITIIGVEINSPKLEFTMEMSPEIEDAIPQVVQMVLDEIKN